MNNKLFFAAITLFFATIAMAQNNIWTATDGKNIAAAEKLERATMPMYFQVYTLNLDALKAALQQAPLRAAGSTSNIIIPFPDADGNVKHYRVYEAPVMQKQLSAKYPGMRSYAGQGIEDPAAGIRFSITPLGLHSMVLSTSGTTYTDPFTKDLSSYIVYKRDGLTTTHSFYCGVTGSNEEPHLKSLPQPTEVNTTDGIMRTYRLAMACTIEYAAFHINAAGLNSAPIAEKKAAVLAAMVVTVARVNSVYERDLSITLQLVGNNDALIFIDSDDFDNENTNNILLDQSQETIDAIIGFDNYDIGHTVSTGGGGVAQLWSPCSGSKAKGITGLWAPVGDPFDIDYVAHEMGHQFGGNHSFNNSCGGNRSDDTAYETGSGTTIMAYAGVCPPNVEMHSDAQFHTNSIIEMSQFITTGGDCGVNTATGNIPPVVNAGADYTIPIGTAFILSGTAIDANNDVLTYDWEQMDREISEQPPVPNAAEGPNFRSLPIKDVPQRFMPDIEDVLNNNLMPMWEVIATVGREYNFAFTVRDNNILGGQVNIDYMKVNVAGEAGPFTVTSSNSSESWQTGTNQNVTWNVAGTTGNGVDTPYVDIFLSTDGGYTYPVTLASKVPNDGAEIVTVPNQQSPANRIMVKGHNNIFYDINNVNLTINAPSTTMAIAVNSEQNITSCLGNEITYTFNYNSYGGFNGATTFSVTGNPAGSTVTFSPATISGNGPVTMTVNTADVTAGGFYSFNVTATSGSVTKQANVYLDLLEGNFGDFSLISPADNATVVFNQTTFDWADSPNATAYTIEIATDENFDEVTATAVVNGSDYDALLEEATQYYWRVKPINAACEGNFSETYTFMTGMTSCDGYTSVDVPVTIPENDATTVYSEVPVSQEGIIQKVSVTMNISHTWVGDLTARLTSPEGTTIVLFSEECGDQDSVNATFDDNGEALECNGNPAISGFLMPEEALSAFNNQFAEGNWQLEIADSFAQDGGAINSWSLNICTVQAVPMATAVNKMADFTLYPNPNNGSFTVKYTSQSGNDIQVKVHDIRGREIFNQAYRNNGVFEQNLSLGSAEAGVYLVTVQDRAERTTKKIVVE